MSTVNVYQLLESVANAMRERDADHLRQSLIETLGEVLPLDAASFVDLRTGASGIAMAPEAGALWNGVSPECRAALVSSAIGGLPSAEVVDGDSLLIMQPVAPDEALVVRLAGTGHDEPSRLVQALARLYMNFTGLIRESEQDRLTGLSNRRSFDSHLAKLAEMTLTAEPPEPRAPGGSPRGPLRWWLALFDVDHFKRINDGYGHLFGDEVLLLIARIIRQVFRGEDRCFRYGGEEFAVILARNDLHGTCVAMERLRQEVERYVFPQVGQVTVSIGCAEIEPGLGPADVIDRADRALYDAKRQGRNRTACFGESSRRVLLRPERAVEMF
jgi:diguanylate cyclase (GGDEF)-like protein